MTPLLCPLGRCPFCQRKKKTLVETHIDPRNVNLIDGAVLVVPPHPQHLPYARPVTGSWRSLPAAWPRKRSCFERAALVEQTSPTFLREFASHSVLRI